MLFEVHEGACPTSFGIHVAELVGFPTSVLALAREKAAQLEATSGGARALLASAGAVQNIDVTAFALSPAASATAASAGAKRFAAELASQADYPTLPTAEKRARLHALLRC